MVGRRVRAGQQYAIMNTLIHPIDAVIMFAHLAALWATAAH
jgi:uncharacterized surface protein with fasciclin (FAS1) repeats